MKRRASSSSNSSSSSEIWAQQTDESCTSMDDLRYSPFSSSDEDTFEPVDEFEKLGAALKTPPQLPPASAVPESEPSPSDYPLAAGITAAAPSTSYRSIVKHTASSNGRVLAQELDELPLSLDQLHSLPHASSDKDMPDSLEVMGQKGEESVINWAAATTGNLRDPPSTMQHWREIEDGLASLKELLKTHRHLSSAFAGPDSGPSASVTPLAERSAAASPATAYRNQEDSEQEENASIITPGIGDEAAQSVSQAEPDHYWAPFTLLYHNVRSLKSRTDELAVLLSGDLWEVSLLCFTEHWLKHPQECDIAGFEIISSFCRQSSAHGGVCCCVRKGSTFQEVAVKHTNCLENVFEYCVSESTETGILIVCVYRPPHGPFESFVNQLEALLNELETESKCIIVLGDFNVDFKSPFTNRVQKLLSLLLKYDLSPVVHETTRYSSNGTETTIDQIFINKTKYENVYETHIIETGFSDHMAIRCTFESIPVKVCTGNKSDFWITPKIKDMSKVLRDLMKTGRRDASFKKEAKEYRKNYLKEIAKEKKRISKLLN